ncbi:hypothetical protein VKT23_005359 [Stygiomarasmius scandens]|uniref:Uncharacterized protein n=1 Tax=Marasmiellus scandens TaxID=2682957 RepID=A0ABR1JQK8_9AGAR
MYAYVKFYTSLLTLKSQSTSCSKAEINEFDTLLENAELERFLVENPGADSEDPVLDFLLDSFEQHKQDDASKLEQDNTGEQDNAGEQAKIGNTVLLIKNIPGYKKGLALALAFSKNGIKLLVNPDICPAGQPSNLAQSTSFNISTQHPGFQDIIDVHVIHHIGKGHPELMNSDVSPHHMMTYPKPMSLSLISQVPNVQLSCVPVTATVKEIKNMLLLRNIYIWNHINSLDFYFTLSNHLLQDSDMLVDCEKKIFVHLNFHFRTRGGSSSSLKTQQKRGAEDSGSAQKKQKKEDSGSKGGQLTQKDQDSLQKLLPNPSEEEIKK